MHSPGRTTTGLIELCYRRLFRQTRAREGEQTVAATIETRAPIAGVGCADLRIFPVGTSPAGLMEAPSRRPMMADHVAVNHAEQAWFELPDSGRVPLRARCAIGRQEDNDLVFDVDTLSRRHALVTLGAMGYFITDLQSRNGTYVNQRLLTRPAILRDGDEIKLGGIMLRFRCNLRLEPTSRVLDGSPTTQVVEQPPPRLCWLLVLDIEGHAALAEQSGSEAALRQLQAWIGGARPVIEKHSGRISRYIGDAILAYWPCDTAKSADILGALRDLETWRPQSPLPFRLVLHQGPVLFTKSEHGEELAGRDMTFVFRMEKIAKGFGSHAMLSSTAVRSLGIEDRCESYGRSAVDGMTDFFAFYGLPVDLLTPDEPVGPPFQVEP